MMSSISGCLIEEENLSLAWFRVLEKLTQRSVDAIVPLTVAITGFDTNSEPLEIPGVYNILDAHLGAKGQTAIPTVANTIFPKSYWNPKLNRQNLYSRFRRAFPNIKHNPANRYGTYFERMINFGDATRNFNQLEHIITNYHAGNHRASAMLVSIFDPFKDHTRQPRRGFPCMQQVTFNIEGSNHDELVVTAVYATQHIYNKAYGNYLGICRLGKFMATELGVKLTRVNFVVSSARLGNSITKVEARNLVTSLEPLITAHLGTQPSSQVKLLTA